MRFSMEDGLMLTRQQADGAIPNGTLIVKINSEPGDGHPDGSLGTGRDAGSIAGAPAGEKCDSRLFHMLGSASGSSGLYDRIEDCTGELGPGEEHDHRSRRSCIAFSVDRLA